MTWPATPVAGKPSAGGWSPDGNTLAIGTTDGRVALWDIRNRALRRAWQAHSAPISSVTWAKGGDSIDTTATDATFTTWDPASGATTRSIALPLAVSDPERGHVAAWSPDRRSVVTTDQQGEALSVWDVTGDEPRRVVTIPHAGVMRVSWSPDSTRFVIPTSDSNAIICDALTGEQDQIGPLFLVANHSTDPVTGEEVFTVPDEEPLLEVAWSPNGDLIAVSNETGMGAVCIWDVARCAVRVPLYVVFGPAVSLVWSPGGDQLAIGTWEGPIIMWSAESGAEREFRVDSEPVEMLVWSPDAKQIATSGIHDEVALRDPATGLELERIHGHNGWLMDIAWRTESRLVSASRGGTISRWEVATGKPTTAFNVCIEPQSYLWTVAWAPTLDRVVTTTSTERVGLWDLDSGTRVASLSSDVSLPSFAAWAPDGSRVAVAGLGTVVVWTIPTADPLAGDTVTWSTLDDTIRSIAWSPNSDDLAVGFDDGRVDIWDPTTGLLQRSIDAHSCWVNSVAWSPDGHRLATGSQPGDAAIWDPDTGRLLQPLEQPANPPAPIRWSPDGALLAGGAEDQLVVWDASSGAIVESFKAHYATITAVAWSADGTQIATSSLDGTLAVADTEQWAVISRLPSLP